MDPSAIFVAFFLLPAVGLVTWAWISMAQVNEELRFFDGFEGMHFELGPHAAENPADISCIAMRPLQWWPRDSRSPPRRM